MNNKDIADIFRNIAKILEIKGENPFRIRAYENGADNIESIGEDLDTLIKADRLTSVSGIGKDLSEKIKEISATGSCLMYEELKNEIPEGVLAMMKIPGLGPKTVKLIYEKLNIDTIEKLADAAKNGKLRMLEGIKEKTEENILRGIELLKKGAERISLYFARNVADQFLAALNKMPEVEKIEAAGSLRRKKDTVRDIDILVVSKKPGAVMKKFTQLPLVKEILAQGKTKASVIAQNNNIQVDVRVVEKESFGAALMYFTGSKQFNIKTRQLGIKHDYKINEYGVFSTQGKEKYLGGKTEEEIFGLLKMAYIPPELREDRGEIETALNGQLPSLVDVSDIKGDFHVHSIYSDGTATFEQIAQKALECQYQYVGVCDHSQSLKVARGLSRDDVYRKIDEIKKLNKKSNKIQLLCGSEVDISSEGKLDYPDDILKEFDLVIAAIHTGFKQSKKQLTKRIVSACKNKYVNIIAHPTGRLWGVREAYEIDWEEVIKACRDYHVALEINAYPQRLDTDDIHALQAKKAGVKLSLGTDSHRIEQMSFIELGVSVARRGWLEKKDVLNCMDLEVLRKWLKK